MERMRQSLKQDDEELVVYGCSAHWLKFQTVMKHVVEVQKYFQNHHKPGAWLSECDSSYKPQFTVRYSMEISACLS